MSLRFPTSRADPSGFSGGGRLAPSGGSETRPYRRGFPLPAHRGWVPSAPAHIAQGHAAILAWRSNVDRISRNGTLVVQSYLLLFVCRETAANEKLRPLRAETKSPKGEGSCGHRRLPMGTREILLRDLSASVVRESFVIVFVNACTKVLGEGRRPAHRV